MAKQVYYARWVHEQKLTPSKLVTLHIDHNKMAPRIQNGDHLLVDQSQTNIINGKIYVLWYNNRLWIKRLYEQENGNLLIRADNPQFMQDALELSASMRTDALIVGRVIHVQGTAGL